jgi:multidrug efflux pump
VRPDGLEDAPQLQIDIDRDKAQALGVPFNAINGAVHRAGLGLRQRLPEPGPLQRVVVQADARRACSPRTCCAARAQQPASRCRCRPSPARAGSRAMQTVRYNGYPAMRIAAARPAQHRRGHGRDGEAGRQAAPGFGYEWTGQSREESWPARRP